jgi:hypothetical protein
MLSREGHVSSFASTLSARWNPPQAPYLAVYEFKDMANSRAGSKAPPC